MRLEKGTSYLLIADPCYQDLILDIKADHPELDLTFLSLDDAFSALGYSYRKDPLPRLLSERRFSYPNAKELMRLLRYARFPEGSYYQKLQSSLIEEGYLFKDELSLYLLQSKKVLVLEEDEDKALLSLFAENKISFSLFHLRDLGLKRKKTKDIPVFLFPDKIHQFAYLFSHLRREKLSLIEQNGNDSSQENEVKEYEILIHDSHDRYFLDFFSSLFRVNVSYSYRYPLLSDLEVKKRMDLFFKEQSFPFPKEETPGVERLHQLVDYYGLGKIDDFRYAFSVLMEIVKSESYVDEENRYPVEASETMKFSLRKKYYVTNFQHGDFYQIGSDKGLFSDEELTEMGANPSYVKSLLDKRKKVNFVLYMDILFLSRVSLHLDDKIFPSELLNELPLEENEEPLHEVKTEFNEKGAYPKQAKNFVLSLFKDKWFFPVEKGYRDYDSSYRKIDSIPFKDTFSVTEFAPYFKCPFQYYLDQVLKISRDDPDQDYFSRKFGNFVHHLFERIYAPDYDFETVFEEAKEQFERESASAVEKNTNERERAWLENSKEYLRRFVMHAQGQFQDRERFLREEHEFPIEIQSPSSDGEKRYTVKGRIDKLLYTKGESGKSFYSIIDYKTGPVFFDPRSVFLGDSLQLPLYYIAMKNQEKESTFGLFGIEKVFSKSPLKDKGRSYSKKAVADFMKIRGIVFADEDFFESIDDETAFTTSRKLMPYGGTYVSKTYSFKNQEKDALKKSLSYSFDALIDDAKKACLAMMEKINRKEFSIAPTVKKGNDLPSCSYCSYRDICYRKVEDIVNLESTIKRHFGTKATAEDTGEEQ